VWETLRLAPVVTDDLLNIEGHAGVVAVAMKRLIPLDQLWRETTDIGVLLQVLCQVAEVRSRVFVTVVTVAAVKWRRQ
jgi:hypothetical protein